MSETPATEELKSMVQDIGSAWRIDWTEIAEAWIVDAKEGRV